MSILRSFLMLLGRLCLCMIFLGSGVNKLMDWNGTAQFMSANGMTNVPIWLTGAILFELLGGAMVLLGFRTRIGAVMLLIFLGSATYVFHHFWDLTGSVQMEQQINFMKNLGIFGGLLMLLAAGPGKISIDGVKGRAG